jgi:hypothetical protein
LAYDKSQKKGTYDFYNYLTVGQQLCHNHYMRIVEPDRHQKAEVPIFIEIDRPTINNTTQGNKWNYKLLNILLLF